MRSLLAGLALVLALVACHGGASDDGCDYLGRHYQRDQIFPAGDGCNQCMCTARGAECSLVACADAGADADVASCLPSGGCASGPACDGLCCGSGERCVDATCQCGQGPTCAAGDTCEAAGPVGNDACGQVCCGASGPCPQ